jgi:hypothetical protein
MATIKKYVPEVLDIGFDLAPELGTAETIASCTATVSPAGLTPTGSVAIDGTIVRQRVTGGVAGAVYIVRFLAVTSTGQQIVQDYHLNIEA